MTIRIAIRDFVEIFVSEIKIVLAEFVIRATMFVSKTLLIPDHLHHHRVLFRTLPVKCPSNQDVKKTLIATLVNIATWKTVNVNIGLVVGIEAAQVVNDVVEEIVFQSVLAVLHVENGKTFAFNIAVTSGVKKTMIAHRISSPVIVQLVVVCIMMTAEKLNLIAIDEGSFAKEVQIVLRNVEIPMIVPEA